MPIVVTQGGALHPAIADLLAPGDGAWDSVTLLGGTAALSSDVEQQAAAAATGNMFEPPVTRFAGATRDDTAFRIASELWPADDVAPVGAAIVNGFSPDFWTYALPGSAAAGFFQAPLLYVQTDLIPDPTDAWLRQFPNQFLITVGPESEVSAATQTAAEESLGSGV